MNEQDLSADLIRFIYFAVPTYPAAVLLVLVSRDPGRHWTAEEVAGQMGSGIDAVRQYAAHFAGMGLLRTHEAGTFQYDPASEKLRKDVAKLVSAYDTRPVTLIRVIYSMPTAKIQAFADSFRFRRE
jgi:hypothetical protein